MSGKRVVPIRKAQNDRAGIEMLRACGIDDAKDDASLASLLELLRTACDAPYAALMVREGRTFVAKAAAGEARDSDADALKRFAAAIVAAHDDAPQSHAGDDAFFAGAALKIAGMAVPAALCCIGPSGAQDIALRQLAAIRDAYAAQLETRKRLTENVSEQLERLYAGLDQFGESAVISEVDPEDPAQRRLIYCGERFARAAGYSVEEVLAHGMRLFVGPRTDVEGIETSVRALLTERRAHFEIELYRKDGTTFWSEWLVQSYDVPGGLHRWFAVVRDLTEQRDRTLQTRSLRRALDESSDFVVTTDGTPVTSGGPIITYANEPFL